MPKKKVTQSALRLKNSFLIPDEKTGLTELEKDVAVLYIHGDSKIKGDRNKCVHAAEFSDQFCETLDETYELIGKAPVTRLANDIFDKPEFMQFLEKLMFGDEGAHVYDKEWCMKQAKRLFIKCFDKQPGIAKGVLDSMMKSLNMFDKKEEKEVTDITKQAAAAQKMWKDRAARRNGHAKQKKAE